MSLFVVLPCLCTLRAPSLPLLCWSPVLFCLLLAFTPSRRGSAESVGGFLPVPERRDIRRFSDIRACMSTHACRSFSACIGHLILGVMFGPADGCAFLSSFQALLGYTSILITHRLSALDFASHVAVSLLPAVYVQRERGRRSCPVFTDR